MRASFLIQKDFFSVLWIFAKVISATCMWNVEYRFVVLASPSTVRILGTELRWSGSVQVPLASEPCTGSSLVPLNVPCLSTFSHRMTQNTGSEREWSSGKQAWWVLASQLGVLCSHSNRLSHWCHNQFRFKGWPLLNCIWMDLSLWLSLYNRDYGERSGLAITDIDCLGNANL